MNKQYRTPAKIVRPGLLTWLLLIALSFICLQPRTAEAACASPVGNAGAIIYNTDFNIMQFCNGGLWVNMTAGQSSQWITTGNDIYYSTGSAGVGATSVPASSVFALTSTTKGFLPPRMTSVQVAAISSPAEGLIAYDTDLRKLKIRTNSAWVNMGGGVIDALACAVNEIVQWNGSAWVCANKSMTSGLNYRLNESGWTTPSGTLASARYYQTVAVAGNYIYMYGGNDGTNPTNTIYRAPLSNPTAWTNTGSTLSANIQAPATTIIDGYIYMFGGWNGSAYTNSIWRAPVSNPTNMTLTGSTLPGTFGVGQIAVIGNYIYLYGGWNASVFMNTIWRAPVSNPLSWSDTGVTLPARISSQTLAQIGNYLYMYGGQNSGGIMNVVWRAPVSDPTAWTDTGATLPAVRHGADLAIIGDYVYILGGNTGSVTNTVIRAPLSDPTSFITLPGTLPGNISYPKPVVVGDDLYLFGGHNGSVASNVIYRASTFLTTRTTNLNVSLSQSWRVLATSTANAVNDNRIVTVNNNNWCAVDGSGNINCDQNPPASTVSTLTDVTAPSPTNNQRLIYSTSTSKWVATTVAQPSCAINEIVQWNGSAWVCANKNMTAGLNYRMNESSWASTGTTLPAARYGAATFTVGDYIYMLGGSNGSGPTNTVYRASLANPGVWTDTGATLPANTQYGTAVVVGNYIYYYGGYNGSAYTNSIWRASTAAPTTWTNMVGSTLPANYGIGETVTVGGFVYLFGNWNGSFSASIWKAPVSNPLSWSNTGSTLPAATSATSLVVIGNYIYLFGGENGGGTLNTIWRADVSDPTTWTNTGATLPTVRKQASLVIVGDYLYLLGGSAASATNTIWRASVSDPTSWSVMSATLPGNFSVGGALAYNNEIYLFGGYNGSGATNVIYRASTNLFPRATKLDVSLNPTWRVLNTPTANAVNDNRIATVNNNQWCAVDSSGNINCDQNAPSTTVAGLSDVTAPSPTNGQKLVYSTGTSKWVATTTAQPSCAKNEIAQWNGTAWVCANKNMTAGLNYRLQENAWVNTGATIPAIRHGGEVAVIGDYVYLFGGGDTSTVTNTIFRAPISNPTAWVNTGATLPFNQYLSQAIVIGNYVYLFGGHNGSGYSNAIYRAPISDPTAWVSTGSNIPANMGNGEFAVIGGYVYMFGGSNGTASNVISRASTANPLSWSNVGTLPTALHGAELAVVGDYVYLFGGNNGAYTNVIYRAPVTDPVGGWVNTGSTLPGNVYASQLAVIGDYLYLFGGSLNGSTSLSAIYRAPLSDPTSWVTTAFTLPAATAFSHLAVIGDNVYLFGGHTGSAATNTIYRAPTYLFTRTTNLNVASNQTWRVLNTSTANAVNDTRIATVNNNQWCAVDGSGVINCDQNAASSTLAGLSDVAAGAPSNGQRLIYNTGTSKWTATTVSQPSCATNEIVQWNGTAWVCANKSMMSGLNYRLNESGWVSAGSLPAARTYNTNQIAVVDGYVYIYGGHTGGSYGNTIYRAPVSNPTAWTNTGATLPTTLYNGNAIVVGDYIYLLGGLVTTSATNVIYRASRSAPTTFTNVGTLPASVAAGHVAIIGSYIYYFGGTNGSSTLNTIYRAPVSNPLSWSSTGTTLPGPMSNGSIAVIGDYVYIYGGTNGSYTNTIYRATVADPTTWTNPGSTLPTNLGYSYLSIIGDYVYLVGGFNGSAAISTIYRAPLSDPMNFSATGAALPGVITAGSPAVIGDYMYVFGGQTTGTGASAVATIYRAPINLFMRTTNVDVTSNATWNVLSASTANAVNDTRIVTINNNKWCAVDGSGNVNCDQNTPSTTLAGLLDVTIGTPTNGQSLVYNSTTSKWVPKTPATLACAVNEIPRWNGSAWICTNLTTTSGLNYRMNESSWSNVGTLPASLYGAATAVIGNYVYIFGGQSGVSFVNTIYRAPITNPTAWVNTGSTLPTASYAAQVAVIDGYIYLFGGYNGSAWTNAIYRASVSDPLTWTNTGSTIPSAYGWQGIAKIGSYLYLYGGNNGGSSATNVIYRASISNPLVWTNPGATLPVSLYGAQVITVGDYMYMFGGYNGSAYVNTIYRAATSDPLTWTNTGATLPGNNVSYYSSIVGDYIYILGGNNGSSMNSVWRAPLSDPTAWVNTGSTLPSGIYTGNQVATIGDNIYIFGGWTTATSNVIYRASTNLFARATNVDISSNTSWRVLNAPIAGSTTDTRITTVNNNSWCATDSSGNIKCDQAAPASTVGQLTDVTAPTPTHGQKLIYNSGSSKWIATSTAQPLCGQSEIAQWNGSAWVCVNKLAISGMTPRLQENSWANVGNTPAGFYFSSQAVIGNYIYLFGGEQTGGAVSSAIYRAPLSNPSSWTTTGGTLPGPIRYAQTVIIGDYIYLYGGANGSAYHNVIYRAPVSNPVYGWVNTGATLPGNLGLSQVAIIGGNVYLFGGYNGSGGVNNIYRATTANPTSFTSVGTLPIAMYGARLAVLGDYLYLFGGYSASALNTIYRAPVSDPLTWTNTGSTLPGTLYYSNHVIIGDYIYLMAGSGSNAIYRASLNDPTNWVNTGSTAPSNLSAGSPVVVGDNVYFYGGHNGAYSSTIYRISTNMFARFANVDVSQNHPWYVMKPSNAGSAAVDPRIATVTNNKWCATDASGIINCTQTPPPATVGTLTDVTATSPTHGQKLVYNTGTSKWVATSTAQPLCALGEIVQWTGSTWACRDKRFMAGLNYRLGDWTNTGASAATAVYAAQSFIAGGYIYLVGGYAGGYLTTVQRASVNSPTSWSNVGNLASAGYDGRVLIIGNYVYLFGGGTAGSTTGTNIIQRADLSAPTTWTSVGTLPFNVESQNMAVIGNTIYMFGGYINAANSPAVWGAPVSNPTSWTNTGATIPGPAVAGAGAFVIGNYIYLYTGVNNAIYRASVSNPLVWTTMTGTAPHWGANSKMAIIGDHIYMLGGYTGSVWTSAVYRAPLSDPTSWSLSTTALPGNLGAMGVFVVGDNLYVATGQNGSGHTAVIYRAPTYLAPRNGGDVDLAANQSWVVLKVPYVGATNDSRITTVNNSQSCVSDGSGNIACDQPMLPTSLSMLTDVTAGSPTNGQRLKYSTASSKWVASTFTQPISCATGEIVQWTGSAWACVNKAATSGLDYRMNESGWISTPYSLPGAVYAGMSAVIGNYVYIFGGHNGSASLNTIYRAPVSNPVSFTSVGTIPATIHGAQLQIINGYIYIFGGINGGSAVNTIYRASTSDPLTWTSVGTLPSVLSWSASAVIGGYVYLFGGYNGGYTSAILRASTTNPTSFTSVGNLPSAMHAHQVVVSGGYVYLYGGHTGSVYSNAIYRASTADPTTWTNTGATSPLTSYLQSVVIVGDSIYILGGNNGSIQNVVWRASLADPTTVINTGFTLPSGVQGASLAVVGDNIYLYGGHNGSSYLSTIYRAPTFLVNHGQTVDIAGNRSWNILAVTPFGSTQDERLGTLTANNYCKVNAGGTLIDCSTAALISNNMLDFSDFKDALTLDASTDISVTGSNALSITNAGTAYSFVVNDQAADSTPFAIDAAGKVSVKALVPNVALDVGGAIVSRGKNAGSATTIDFSQGNTAYTTAACGAFTLTGIQDGGQYTLVVKGSGAGPATFTQSGVTVKTYGTMNCTVGKHMTFTFIRAGTDVYVSHITGF